MSPLKDVTSAKNRKLNWDEFLWQKKSSVWRLKQCQVPPVLCGMKSGCTFFGHSFPWMCWQWWQQTFFKVLNLKGTKRNCRMWLLNADRWKHHHSCSFSSPPGRQFGSPWAASCTRVPEHRSQTASKNLVARGAPLPRCCAPGRPGFLNETLLFGIGNVWWVSGYHRHLHTCAAPPTD